MAAPKLSERRVSQRYMLPHNGTNDHAVFEKSIALPLLDISYGGFSVAIDKPEHESLCDTLPKTADVEVIVLGVSTSGRAIRVFESKQRLGYAFCHDTASVLIFMRRFIEFMRMGEHLNTLDRSLLKPPYDSTDWLCFRGDGPTDVVMHLSKSSPTTVDEGAITYREKDSYRTAELRSGKIFTFVSAEARNKGSSTASQDTTPNEDIMRKAACILMGYLQACHESHQPAVLSLLNTIRKSLYSPQQQRAR